MLQGLTTVGLMFELCFFWKDAINTLLSNRDVLAYSFAFGYFRALSPGNERKLAKNLFEYSYFIFIFKNIFNLLFVFWLKDNMNSRVILKCFPKFLKKVTTTQYLRNAIELSLWN
jgi:hypothetical protein